MPQKVLSFVQKGMKVKKAIDFVNGLQKESEKQKEQIGGCIGGCLVFVVVFLSIIVIGLIAVIPYLYTTSDF